MYNLGVLNSTGTSISCNSRGQIVATASISYGPNVLIATVPSWEDAMAEVQATSISMSLGDETTELTGSAMKDGPNMDTNVVIVSGRGSQGGRAYLLDTYAGQVTGRVDSGTKQFRSTDWLNHNTALIGCRNGAVMLWDDRTFGSALRFNHPGEAKQVHAVGDGFSVWVASSHCIYKYDTRMTGDLPEPPNAHEAGSLRANSCSTHGHPKPRRGGPTFRGTTHSKRITQPVCGISSDFSADMQMAVWKEMNMVAVSGHATSIELFDGRSGEKHGFAARSDISHGRDRTSSESARYRIGRIRAGVDHRGDPYLFYAYGTDVHRYVC